MNRNRNKNRAFTLIELLVVIAIIALLASIVLIALSSARAKSRDATRRATINQIGTALELYYSDNGHYPIVPTWSAVNPCWGSSDSALTGATGYIPGLAPTYVGVLPTDPLGYSGCGRQYLYLSDTTGANYLFMDYGGVENCTNISSDPMRRPGYPNECDYATYTPGGSQW